MKKKKASNKQAVGRKNESKLRGDKSKNPEPIEWYTISDPEQVKLITNDLRSRILIEFAKNELTAKQVAERLGEPPTKFYRHVAALAEHGLIVPTREEKKRGTIQQFYRAIAQRFRVDDTCFTEGGTGEESKTGAVLKLLNTIGTELTESSRDSANSYIAAMTSPFFAPEDKMEEIGEKLFEAIIRVFDDYKPALESKKSDKEFRFSLLIHPMASKTSRKSSSKTKAKKKKKSTKSD